MSIQPKPLRGAAGFALGAGLRAIAVSILSFAAIVAGERRLYATRSCFWAA